MMLTKDHVAAKRWLYLPAFLRGAMLVLTLHIFFTASSQTNSALLRLLNNTLTEAVVHDGFSPPVASRIYAYCHIAAYQAVCFSDSSSGSLEGKLNHLHLSAYKGASWKKLNAEVVLVATFSRVAVEMVYRDFIIEQMRDSLLPIYKSRLDSAGYRASIDFGERLAAEIVSWASTDQYRETRTMPRFSVSDGPAYWQPTAPTYGEAAEPHWMKIRPFFLDSASQFQLAEPMPFDSVSGSPFWFQNLEVLRAVKLLDSNQMNIARFWDCNPQRTFYSGHVMYNARQLTPPGHWLHVTAHVCSLRNLSLVQSAYVMALTATAMADGFIACWNEKYRTNLIRPETYIGRYIDKHWKPFLETPLFPEHPSGHSVVSAAAATILENFFGTSFAFTDSAEAEFNNGIRTFTSFREAADEAAESRIYGGIHYRAGCEEGKVLGNHIAQWVLRKSGRQ